MRVLPDLTQAPVRGQPGVRGYVVRDLCDPMPGAMLTDEQAQARNIRLRGAPAPDPVPAPRPAILPMDQGQAHPLWVIVDRRTDLVLARVRGEAAYVKREAMIIAREHGGNVADLRVILSS